MVDYLKLNQEQWDQRTKAHLTSDFYDVPGWLAGAESLKTPELDLLPDDLTGLKILHLQCHFGQDTLSFVRRGADATGVDLSPAAITAARDLAGPGPMGRHREPLPQARRAVRLRRISQYGLPLERRPNGHQIPLLQP